METNNFIISKDKESIKTELWWLVYDIILARYEYQGIDGDEFDMELDSIERALMYSGMCAIFKNEAGKIVALPCVLQKLNQYGRPATVVAYKFSFDETQSIDKPNLTPLTTELKVGVDCALILNNAMRTSSMVMVQPYINRLAKIWKEHGNNLTLSRIFAIIGGANETVEAINSFYKRLLEDGMIAVPTTDVKAFKETLQKFDLGVEYRQEQYHKDFEETWVNMLTMLGINNVGVEKRERLLVDEISANNEVLNIIRSTTLKYREAGIKQANRLFGTNIKVINGGIDEERETQREVRKDTTSDSEVGGDDTR